jgi:hypothetical protein
MSFHFQSVFFLLARQKKEGAKGAKGLFGKKWAQVAIP